MYDELEWLLILIAAAVGVGIIGGTLLRGPRDLAPFDRYGCLPGLGLGGLGVVGTTFGLPLLDPGVEPLGGLLLGGASMSTGLAVGYGFSKTDLGLGEKGSYVLGAGSLLLSGGLAFGLAGPGGTPGPQPTGSPGQPTATGSASAAPSPTASASPSSTPSASPTATAAAVTASPTVPIGLRTDFFDALVELGALEQGRVDEYMDDYELDPEGDHSHASGATPGFRPGHVDLRGYVGFSWTIDAQTAETLNDAFPCAGAPSGSFFVQCLGTMPIAAGDWVFVNVMAHGPLPATLGDGELATFAVVFDDDGDPATGYRPEAAFPGDSFQGSTRWYEQVYFGNRSTCMATDATRLNDQGFPERNNFMSQGRFVSWRVNSLGVAEYVLMVPGSEVGEHYRAVIVGTRDATTYAAEDTSHDYSEAAEPFSFHRLETY